jgi:Zn-dependent M28 family amino/carboxypeptidase
MLRTPLIALAALSFAAAAAHAQDAGPISPERLAQHVTALAAPALAGRAPGGPGEAGTLAYIEGQFKALGLSPAGDNGGWTQEVPLLHFRMQPTSQFSLTAGGQTIPLVETKDLMVGSQRPQSHIAIKDAPLVFVGYGVSAPERGWDDFKGVDLKGKIAVVLINDPDFEAQAGEPVAGKFGGKAATYYARWTYKYEEMARRGALGVLIVHETAGAAYPWSTVVASNGEGYDIVRPDADKAHTPLQGWIQRPVAVDLFKRAGLDFEAEKLKARTIAFRPVVLKAASFSADYNQDVEHLVSHNVLAKIDGAKHPDQSIMFAAHWDAFGLGPADSTGDRVRHGAADDGVGVAGVIEIARAFAAAPKPDRSVVFAAWTGEERGLLGSEYYATHPLFPLARTAGNFTIDVLQTAGPSHDVVLVGAGQDSLEQDFTRIVQAHGRTVTPDPHPERALFFRADHFSVAKRGVPTLLLMEMSAGPDLVAGGRAAGDRWVEDYTTRCYHQVCDNIGPDWDLRGAAADVGLLYATGRELANSQAWPTWNAGSEFKQVRERSVAERK